MLKINQLKMNQVTENNQGGGNTSQTPPPATPTKAEGDKLALDTMYKTEPEAAAPEKQPEQKAVQDEKAAPSVTGYGDIPADPPAPTETKPAEKVETPADPTKVEFDAKGLSDAGKTLVEEFAKKNALSKEATQAFADHMKIQVEALADLQAKQVADAKEAAIKQRKDWNNELLADKEFGGENYDKSLKKVDTVMERFFPNTKNLLTTNKGILPPSIMKDLHALHKTLLGSSDAMLNPESGATKSGHEFLDEFYK